MTDVHTSAAHAFRSSSVRRARRRRKEGRMGSRAVRTSPYLSQRRAPDTRLHTGQSPWVGSTPRGLSAGCQEPSPYFLPVLSTWTVSVFLPTDSYLQHCLAFAVLVRKGGWSSESTDGVGGCKRAKRMAFLNADLLSSRLEETPPSALGSIEQPERNNPHAARSLTPGKGP